MDDASLETYVVIALVKIVLLIGGLMTGAAYLVLLERKIAAWVQDRRGPERVGIPLTKLKMFGLGQPLADGLKIIFKEEHTPRHVDRVLYFLAPVTILASALAIFAVIPFGSVLPADLGIEGIQEPIQLIVAPGVDVGVLFVFALSSLAVYGVILGGWASNNKYSFLGGLRSSAQLIAYELPLGLGILGVVLLASSMRLDTIITHQAETGYWNALVTPLGFLVFVVAAFAEAARLPFDLPEAEQELIGGYHTEYSGVKLLMYLVAEFLHMITASFLIVILFLGGWHFWGLTGSSDEVTWGQAILRVVILSAKILAVIVFFMMVRWSWPRFRFDQLMQLAWKVMLPLGMVNLAMLAVWVEFAEPIGSWLGAYADLKAIAIMWFISLLIVIAAAVLAPLHTDNRPRLNSAARGEFFGP